MTPPLGQSFPALCLQALHHKKLSQIYKWRHQGCLLENWVRNPRMTFPRPQQRGMARPLFPQRFHSHGGGQKEGQCAKDNPMGTNFQTRNSLYCWSILCIKKNPKLKTFPFDQNYSRIQFKLHQHKLLLKILNKTCFLIAPCISIRKVSRFELPKPPRPHFSEGSD